MHWKEYGFLLETDGNIFTLWMTAKKKPEMQKFVA